MFFLISLVLAFAFAFVFAKPIKKNPAVFYIIAVLFCIFSAVVDIRSLPQWIADYIAPFFTKSLFATGLWAVVMWTGAFPNGSGLIKKLMPIRGELSIMAAVLTFGHNIGYGKIYFVRLFTVPSRLPTNQLIAGIFTIIMLCIMIPLTIMSFKSVRKKINPKTWKKIQRSAYVFYALLYAHVMVLCVPMAKMGRAGYFANVIVYSIVFIGYAVCRVRKQFVKNANKSSKSENIGFAKLNTVSAVAFAVAVFVVSFAFKPQKQAVLTAADLHSNNNSSAVEISIPDSSGISSGADTSDSLKISDSSNRSDSSGKPDNSDSSDVISSVTDSSSSEKSVNPEESRPEETNQEQQENNNQSQEQYQEQQPENNNVPEENNNQQQENYEQQQTEQQSEQQPEQPQEQQPPEPQYTYNNGTYTAKAYGFDGDVEVSITIENDVITSITGSSAESDTWYFDSAKDFVINQILQNQNTQVDAYSGATYSSEAIMSAVAQAMESAKK